MQIQVNTDNHIQNDASVSRHVETAVETALARFANQITRVEAHLHDRNADKKGSNDKHCVLEARIEGRPPIAVSSDAETIALAVTGAAKKLQRAVESSLGRLH